MTNTKIVILTERRKSMLMKKGQRRFAREIDNLFEYKDVLTKELWQKTRKKYIK